MPEIDSFIKQAAARKASDLHLCSARKPMLRRDGDMIEMDSPAPSDAEMMQLLKEIMPDRNSREFESTNDTDFAYEIPDTTRLRVSVFRDSHGTGAVFRLIPSELPSLDRLHMPDGVQKLCSLPKGLVLVTGPTGSGKTTTLTAMIDMINRTRAAHIITIEDPIEFIHQETRCRINQREVHSHTGGFAHALRASLRQDPDIVFVGEMPDLETIEMALHTSETGHLVLATLHTNTAARSIDRIIDCFPGDRRNRMRSILASALKGVIAQTLCRRTDGGRVAAVELLTVNRGIAALIREGKTHQIPSAMQIGNVSDMLLMSASLADLVTRGDIEPEEAYARAIDREDLLAAFRKQHISFKPADR